MNANCKTELLEKYKGKSVSEFNTLQDVLLCGRINYTNKKKKINGLSQTAAAKLYGIDASTLSRLENGNRKKPELDNAFRIEEVLGLEHGTIARLI